MVGSEDGPQIDTGDGTDTGDEADTGDDDGDTWGGGTCDRGNAGGALKWLDVCYPPDPCGGVVCSGDQVCLGGQCIAPQPSAACTGIELTQLPTPADFDFGSSVPLFANLDGVPGDELITADGGVIEVARAGELLASYVLPTGSVASAQAMQFDGDGQLDLLVESDVPPNGYTVVALGDGDGRFSEAFDVLPLGDEVDRPLVLDYDSDGADDLVAYLDGTQITQVYRNAGGSLVAASEFEATAMLGVATDLDLDGSVDDALFGRYPSPLALYGVDGELVEAGSLPEPRRGPDLEYGVGRSFAADLDGDGFAEVISMIADNHGRVGARVWWGLPDNQFDDPRDQLLVENLPDTNLSIVGLVELDGVAPPEILVRENTALHYARVDLSNHLAFACVTQLGYFDYGHSLPAIGDIEADGQLEIAVRNDYELEVWGITQVP